MGNIVFPEGIYYVIGDFTYLFGKPTGQLLQSWCIQYGWPLVWSIGVPNVAFFTNQHPFNTTAPLNKAFLDPTTLSTSMLGNISATEDLVFDFGLLWEKTNLTLTDSPENQMNSTFWYSLWNDTISNVIPPSLIFNYQQVGDCSDTVSCLGVDDEGHCICLQQ